MSRTTNLVVRAKLLCSSEQSFTQQQCLILMLDKVVEPKKQLKMEPVVSEQKKEKVLLPVMDERFLKKIKILTPKPVRDEENSESGANDNIEMEDIN